MNEVVKRLFKQVDIEVISKVFRHTNDGLVGSEIDSLLGQAKIKDVEPTSSNWRRLYSAFYDYEKKEQNRAHVVEFIKLALSPQRYISNPQRLDTLRKDINEVLKLSGLEVSEWGELVTCEKKSTSSNDSKFTERGAFAFISYSHNNKWALERLHTHLAMLRRDKLIHAWCDRDILAGGYIDQEITERLESCELFLALISPDFIASDYCYEREMSRALERHELGEVRVVPIIIEPCEWKKTPLGRLRVLPDDGEPLSKWDNEDEAFLDVVTELRRILNTINTSDQWKHKFNKQDHDKFRDTAFIEIRSSIKEQIAGIDHIMGIRSHFADAGKNGFTSSLVMPDDKRTISITVLMRTGDNDFGDIYYSYLENAPDNMASGGYAIRSDGHELFLSRIFTDHTDPSKFYEEQRLSPTDVAEVIWGEHLERAGYQKKVAHIFHCNQCGNKFMKEFLGESERLTAEQNNQAASTLCCTFCGSDDVDTKMDSGVHI